MRHPNRGWRGPKFTEGRFPFDWLIRSYKLEEINQACADMGVMESIKPVLRVAYEKNLLAAEDQFSISFAVTGDTVAVAGTVGDPL